MGSQRGREPLAPAASTAGWQSPSTESARRGSRGDRGRHALTSTVGLHIVRGPLFGERLSDPHKFVGRGHPSGLIGIRPRRRCDQRCWGHGVTRDFVTWEHRPIALEPNELGTIISGSAVIDADDTAGFGPGALVAAFTYDTDDGQSQALASSVDGGATFARYAGNPVIPIAADRPIHFYALS